MTRSWLRVDARSLADDEMFVDQKRVAWQLEEAIDWARKSSRCAVDGSGEGVENSSNSRTNRILFLHGVSGVGKTSVYLTIRDKDQKKANSKESAVWLDPLEFGILKDAPNALSDMLALIEDKVQGCHSKSEVGYLSQEKNDCIKKLRQLQNRISEVWDGAPKKRAVHVAPQAFAAEVVDVSRWRAKLRRELNELIDDVSKHFFDGRLLILPIDDMHEHPGMALETLRLLRLIHSSRFLTLAIGDIELLKDIERFRILKEMGYGKVSVPHMERQTEMQAVYSLSKTVPVAQRFELMPPDPGDDNIASLVGFRPSRAMSDTLGALLENMGVCKPDFAGMRAWVFKVPARHLVDMYMELSFHEQRMRWEETQAKKEHRKRSKEESAKRGRSFAQDFAWRQFDILVRTTGWFDDGDVKLLRGMIRPKTGASSMELEVDTRLASKIAPCPGGEGLLIVEKVSGEQNGEQNGERIDVYHAIQAWLRLTLSLIDENKYPFENNTLRIVLVDRKDGK